MPLPTVNIDLAQSKPTSFLQQVAERAIAATRRNPEQSIVNDEIDDNRNHLDTRIAASDVGDPGARMLKIKKEFAHIRITDTQAINNSSRFLAELMAIQAQLMDKLTDILNISTESEPSYELSHALTVIGTVIQAMLEVFPEDRQEAIFTEADSYAKTHASAYATRPLLLQTVGALDQACINQDVAKEPVFQRECGLPLVSSYSYQRSSGGSSNNNNFHYSEAGNLPGPRK